MSVIYVDEAGTSHDEPYRVVVGVNVPDGEHNDAIFRAMNNLFDQCVPSALRPEFQFHAKEVFNGGKLIRREDWPQDQRLHFYKAFLAIAPSLRLPIHIGAVQAGTPYDGLSGKHRGEMDHILAFTYMMDAANRHLQRRRPSPDRLSMVYERVPEREGLIRAAYKIFKEASFELSSEHLHRGLELGSRVNTNFRMSGERFIDVPNFALKSDAPVLQLADAIAFAFRRYLAGGSHGPTLLKSVIGWNQLPGSWCLPAASVTYCGFGAPPIFPYTHSWTQRI